MFKLYKKANHNDYGLIIAAVFLLLMFNLSFLYYVQNKQRDIERHHAQSLANNFSRILNEEFPVPDHHFKGGRTLPRWQGDKF